MTHMLRTATVILAALLTRSIAADPPKELTSLKDSYIKARSKAVAPIEKKYLEALIAMKTKFTKAGDLDAALFVDSEIRALQPSTDSSTTTAPTTTRSDSTNSKQLRLTKELSGTSWDCDTWKATMTMNADGTVTFSGPKGSMTNWKITKTGKLALSQDGTNFREFDLAKDNMSFEAFFGGALDWKRKKP
ncbi:MAG: hypothetical protein K1X78_22075 [Verrucomicrobiaceae bacterium]|nr:hypothetical protein [Verrucomicrobiaceae bacterium]